MHIVTKWFTLIYMTLFDKADNVVTVICPCGVYGDRVFKNALQWCSYLDYLYSVEEFSLYISACLGCNTLWIGKSLKRCQSPANESRLLILDFHYNVWLWCWIADALNWTKVIQKGEHIRIIDMQGRSLGVPSLETSKLCLHFSILHAAAVYEMTMIYVTLHVLIMVTTW